MFLNSDANGGTIPGITRAQKEAAWQDIAKQISLIGKKRTWEHVKKKKETLFSKVKAKVS